MGIFAHINNFLNKILFFNMPPHVIAGYDYKAAVITFTSMVGEFPFMASLVHKPLLGARYHFCGGSIYNEVIRGP